MSLSVTATLDDSSHRWFTNHDILKGQVALQIKDSVQISDITVYLIGISKTALSRVDDYGHQFTDQVDDLCVLLNVEQVLFPPADHQLGENYSMKSGEYKWPFKFCFPERSSGLEQCFLPPSLSDLDFDVGYIKYYIEVVVRHSMTMLGISSSTGSSTYRIPIVFLPTDSVSLDHVPTYGVLNCQQSRVVSNTKTVSGLLNRLVTSIAHENPATCSNVCEFAVRMELLLTPGLEFSWTVEAWSNVTNKEDLVITAIKVKLVSHTNVRAKNVTKKLEKSEVLYEKSNLNLTVGNLTAQLGNPLLKLRTSTPPSFQAPNLQRDYSLELRISWNHRQTSITTHKAYLNRNVYVRSGIQTLPNYETGDAVRPNRDYPQAKWYFR